MVAAEVVMAEFWDYIVNVVERSSSIVGGLPLCPFVKKFKTKKVRWIVGELEVNKIAETGLGDFVMLAFIDPRKHLELPVFEAIVVEASRLRPDCFVMSGHPDNTFELKGVRTHSEPYPNILVTYRSFIKDLEKKLLKTRYYSGFSHEELQQYFDINFMEGE